MERFTLHGSVVCSPGLVRKQNQDNFYLNGVYREDLASMDTVHASDLREGDGLYAVADGMGGEQDGEIASFYAVRSMKDLQNPLSLSAFCDYLIERNAEICKYGEEHGSLRCGTTFVGLSIRGNTVDMVNIGDSRAYLLRHGRLIQLSEDHTAAQQMVYEGSLTPEEAARRPERSMLTRCLGVFPADPSTPPYVISGPVQAGDIFLLCSDGLHGMVSAADIQAALQSDATLPEQAESLAELALQAGGRDNVTVLLVQVNDQAGEETTASL